MKEKKERTKDVRDLKDLRDLDPTLATSLREKRDSDLTTLTTSTSTISLSNIADKSITIVGQRDRNIPESGKKLTITIKDVLDLIPIYEGRDIIEFIHFQEGCKDALELIGSDQERTLMKFLKLKLRGNAKVRFSLHVDKYDRLYRFLRDVKKEYNYMDMHDPDFWVKKMATIVQRNREPIREYGQRCEDLLQCAINMVKSESSSKNILEKEKLKKTDIDYLESKAFYYFQKNIASSELQTYLGDFHLRAKNFQEFISVAEPWEEVIKEGSKGCWIL
ncbi:hypothetical protein QAD02_015607 [Eretmocerus hayati]|uniref:Uncharacterized protein n=1 Tax=Eretmocerus hayati TaxID=131215 RepID=A0ACC2P8U0_9HYME|nr:hypothetical protein QAD02_015607 [Eretmocerus hayati]